MNQARCEWGVEWLACARTWLDEPLKKSDFDFILPESLIAQSPPKRRTDARLMVVHRDSGLIEDRQFADLPQCLGRDDLLVFNNTRVIPARLFGHKTTGGRVEVLFERILSDRQVLAQIRSSKAPRAGTELILTEREVPCRVMSREGRFFLLEFSSEDPAEVAESYGHMPLPPYIQRSDESEDRARYQTVYAKRKGAVAAPTAGLHFDEAMLSALEAMGVMSSEVTLHVGAGTFQPVQVDNILEHEMHQEWFEISQEAAASINAARDERRRIIAVGTTSVRTLESAVQEGRVVPQSGDTQIFIYPGYEFQMVDALLTNFHLPGSTLLMLVSALANIELIQAAYAQAIEKQYRFFSYGDAMLIV